MGREYSQSLTSLFWSLYYGSCPEQTTIWTSEVCIFRILQTVMGYQIHAAFLIFPSNYTHSHQNHGQQDIDSQVNKHLSPPSLLFNKSSKLTTTLFIIVSHDCYKNDVAHSSAKVTCFVDSTTSAASSRDLLTTFSQYFPLCF